MNCSKKSCTSKGITGTDYKQNRWDNKKEKKGYIHIWFKKMWYNEKEEKVEMSSSAVQMVPCS